MMHRSFRLIFRLPRLCAGLARELFFDISNYFRLLALRIANGKRLEIGEDVSICWRSKFKIDSSSKIVIERDCILRDCKVVASSSSFMHIHKNTKVLSADILILNSGKVSIGEQNIFSASQSEFANRLAVNGGVVEFGLRFTCDGAKFDVRENALLKIGKYSGIGHNSEIRAEVGVAIGDYTMISKNVSIFDTNAHSLDFQERRDEVEYYWEGIADRGSVACREISIGNDCWIGQGCAIAKGAIIGNRCVLGMQTFINTGVYPSDSKIVAQKCRVISIF